MTRDDEIALISELLGLDERDCKFLDDGVTYAPVERYSCANRFSEEMQHLFRAKPVAVAQTSELEAPDTFLSRVVSGLPVLLTRDGEGLPHAFLNVCRHRGAKLVRKEKGCKNRFSCPYHAWTWSNTGDLVAVPHERQGFPNLDRKKHALKALPILEAYGFLWIIADCTQVSSKQIKAQLASLDADLSMLELSAHRIALESTFEVAANWKLLVEGGIEAYHFHVVHRKTIRPYFPDNLSSYQMLGTNMRSILPRNSLLKLRDKPQDEWNLRENANIIYSIFPGTQLLAQQDHVVWIQFEPLAVDRTRVRLATLVPETMPKTVDMEKHWAHNQTITVNTLKEDFELGDEIQKGLSSGANTQLTFGRFEGALAQFSHVLNDAMKAPENA